jgi:ribosomal protein S18 acetylase RimI-like enzyme
VTGAENLQVSHHDAAAAGSRADVLRALYAEIYADKVDDPFFSVERFGERLQTHLTRPGYALVTGELDGELVGYAYGLTLLAETQWWNGLKDPLPEEFRRETGERTFAVNEIMVRKPWRRRGIARRLHDALLDGRPEERATLLVEHDNGPAKAAYLKWGWRHVGQLQPFPDAPLYDSMVLQLRPSA